MTPFFTRLSDRALQTYFYLFVPDLDSGYYFPTSDLPLSPLGGTTVVPCLDITSLRISDATLSRKAGVATPKSLSLTLGPENSEILTTVLATTDPTTEGMRLEGRLAYLVAGLADHSGVPIDADYWDGPGSLVPDHQCVVFAGPIEACQVGPDWHAWQMQILSLEALLDTELGQKIEAELSPFGWGLPVGSIIQGQEAKPGQNKAHFLLTVTIGATTYEQPLEGDLEYLDADGVGQAISDAANSFLSAKSADPVVDYYAAVYDFNDPQGYLDDFKAGKFRVRFNLWLNPDLGDTSLVSDVSVRLLPQEPDSGLPYLGFVAEQEESVGAYSSTSRLFVADENPLALWLSPQTRTVEVWLDDSQPEPPDSGYIVLSNGDRKEVAYYGTRSGGIYEQGRTRYTLNLYDADDQTTRGQFGTQPLEVKIPIALENPEGTDEWTVRAAEAVKVQFAAAKAGHLLDIAGMLVTNDGDSSSPYYDATQPAGYCGTLNYQLLDLPKWAALTAGNALQGIMAKRQYAFVEAGNLREWLSQELQGVGLTLQARTVPSTAEFLLTLDQVTQPLVATVWNITANDLIQSGTVDLDHVTSGCVNRAEVEFSDDFGGPEQEQKYQINFTGSQTRLKRVLKESYKVRGVPPQFWSVEQIAPHFLGLLAPYSYPYELVSIPLRRQFWQVQPGDMASLTLAGLPKPTGGRGWTDEALVVIGIERVLAPSGDEPPCILHCLHAPDRRLSYYSPSGRVSAWDAGAKLLTIEANAYSTVGDWILDPTVAAKDIRWFADAAYIEITQQANDSSTEKIAVTSVNLLANRFVLTAAPTFAPVAGDFVTLPTWDDRAASEKRFVAIADAGGFLGTNNDPAFRYAG